jgi:hypothetical protein
MKIHKLWTIFFITFAPGGKNLQLIYPNLPMPLMLINNLVALEVNLRPVSLFQAWLE